MKHLFIVNPTAGGSDKTAIVTERVNAAFSHFETSGDTYEIYVTKAPMDAPGKIKADAAENEKRHNPQGCKTGFRRICTGKPVLHFSM